MRIGTLTLHRTQNYGGLLQAFALQAVLNGLGAESQIIDYRSTAHAVEVMPGSRPSIINFRRFILDVLSRRAAHGVIDFDAQAKSRLDRSFAFMRECLPLSTPITNLRAAEAQGYDLYLTGSDQIWSPHVSHGSEYLLDFAPDTACRASYAASFGVHELPSELRAKYKSGLNKFHFISVREESGARIVKDVAGRDASTVLDPTLLLDRQRWLQLASLSTVETGDAPYALCYFLGDFNTFLPLLEQMCEQRQIRVVVLVGHRWAKKQYAIKNREVENLKRLVRLLQRQDGWTFAFDAGPLEFLKYMANASFVLTDSFHGMSMAICLEKCFDAVIETANRRQRISTRLRHLAALLGVEGNIHDTIPNASSLTGEWDRAKVREALRREQEKSLAFIHAILACQAKPCAVKPSSR